MKNLLVLALSVVLFAGCSKARKTYQIIIEKSNSLSVDVDIDDASYHFTESTFTQEIEVDKIDAIAVFASYSNYESESIRLTVKKRGDVLKTEVGEGYVSAIITRDDITSEGGHSYTSSTTGTGSSTSGGCTCGATTQAGNPCKRAVVCGSGYCWQHD